MTIDAFDLEKAYYFVRTIRRTEEKIAEIYYTDKVKSPVHLSIGQEAIAVGACMALRANDTVFSNYRGHAHYLARGGNLNAMWAELYGKENGLAGGKAGSMHLADLSVNFMPASAIVTSAVSNAVGFALAEKMRNTKNIVMCFHGEGAVDEGVFWESLNFAALKQAPILFVCENNDYAIYSTQAQRMAGSSIAARAHTFGITTSNANGYSSEDVYAATAAAVTSVREGKGPALLEVDTYRWRDHVGPDDDHEFGYRETQHLKDAVAKDDMAMLASKLGTAKAAEVNALVEVELDQALAFAESGDFPDADALMRHAHA